MQQSLFKKLLELSKKTGDRIVFADVEGTEAYVVLPLADYERLILGGATLPKKDIDIKEYETVSVQSMHGSNYKKSPNALDEISREIVKTLEGERLEDAKPVRLPINDEMEIESEERYYLEPLE